VRPARILATVTGCLILAGSLFITCSAFFNPQAQVFVLAAPLAPWAILGYLLAGLLLIMGRSPRSLRVVGCLIASIGLILHVAWIVPSFKSPKPIPEANLRVIQFNTNRGHADPLEVKALLAKTKPDVFVMAEATPDFLTEINANGAVGPGGIVPEYAEVPPGQMLGVVTYARFPITFQDSTTVSDGAYSFKVHAPNPFNLIAVHTAEPLIAFDNYRRDYANLLPMVKHAPRPLLVVGDLNVTGDSLPFKELTKLGLRDAAIGAGSGWQPTWPSKLGPLALLTLDHVLFSDDFEVAKTTTVRVPGSDHLALIADLLGPA